MIHKTRHLELRIMELEDTVRLMAKIIHNMNQIVKDINQVTGIHTEMILGTRRSLGEACGCAKDDDPRPWSKYT